MRLAAVMSVLAILVGGSPGGCEREERPLHTVAPSSSAAAGLRLTSLQPGEPLPHAGVVSFYDRNAYALNEGKTLFSAFNCVGCHSHGGGGMGPALMDDVWIYGSEPEQVYATILEGRPNGMPSFRGKITDDQAWKLAAYVRSLSGMLSRNAAPGRSDHMQVRPPENSMPRPAPVPSAPPGAPASPK